MKNKLSVVKIGGNVINNEEHLEEFLINFSKLEGLKILVHGGGTIATKMSDQLGVVTEMIDGRRITSAESLDVVTMVYAGLINKRVVAKLQNHDCNAIGLTGADANCITSSVRINYGWVGNIKEVNTANIKLFLSNSLVPIFCPINHNGKGQLLNTNADTIAAEIAIAMSKEYETKLVYCFEKKGVLRDINDDNSIISWIDKETYQDLKANGNIDRGMLPKMENCFLALENDVSSVVIGNIAMIQNQDALHTTLTL